MVWSNRCSLQDTCGTRTIACDACKKLVMRRSMEEHTTNVCPVLCAHLLASSPMPPPLPSAAAASAFPFDGTRSSLGSSSVDEDLLVAAMAAMGPVGGASASTTRTGPADAEDKELQRAVMEVRSGGGDGGAGGWCWGVLGGVVDRCWVV